MGGNALLAASHQAEAEKPLVQRNTGCTSKRDAERYEADQRRRAALGEETKPALTLNEACGAWWLSKGQHLRSYATVDYQLANLIAGVGASVALGDVTLLLIDGYVARRRTKVKNSSVNRETSLLRRVISWAEARGYEVPKIEWREVRLKEAAVQTRVLDYDEESRLFDTLPDSLKPLVEFALLSGQRKTEIVALRWSDVDLGNARATVWAKGQRPHSFPLTPRMITIIASQPKVCAQVFTYVAERSSPTRPDRVQRVKGQRYPFSAQGWDRKWRKALESAGIADYRFHDNRHTAATRSGSIEVANVLLGHSDMRTTQRYFHTAEDTVRKAMIEAESRNSSEPVSAMPENIRKSAND
jgi:integrase